MGYRAIRICLDRPEVFKTQLRALFRASMFGNISIMYPMIISVTEVKQIKAIVAEVKAELKEQGIPFRDDVEQLCAFSYGITSHFQGLSFLFFTI